ncbi:MAG: hypothetical protein GDA39_06845 [Hyphomonadaceae bacterium]|nr:hypothetical protein [Hyphomonadaceae bacterium]MBC6412603.1 hypothetical protein [Hyphomonadaceae bacterium]
MGAFRAWKASQPFDIRDNPDRASQKDTGARWTIKYSKKKASAPKGCVDIATPHYGYKSHIMTDKSHSFIRSFKVTDAGCHDGATASLRLLITSALSGMPTIPGGGAGPAAWKSLIPVDHMTTPGRSGIRHNTSHTIHHTQYGGVASVA